METPSATRRRIWKQVMKVSGVCLGAINMGLMLVWPSVAFTDLQRENTTIYGNSIALSDTHMDLIGSILPAGSFFGTLAGGYVVARIGRRRSMLWLTVPSIVAWVILALSCSLIMILIGRDQSAFEGLNETVMTKSFARRHTWMPVTCLLVFMAGASLGITQVPFILNSEYFPTTIRAQASSICLMASNLLNVLALQLFTPIQAVLTPAGFYWFTAGICTFGVIFSFIFIIETKDKAIA